MADKIELKPCPFCGGKAVMVSRSGNPFAGHTVGCRNDECYSWIPRDVHLSKLHNYQMVYTYKEDAISNWNKRLGDTA